MRPNKPQRDRMSSLTLYSDIFSKYRTARQKFDSMHTRLSNIIENRGQNLSVNDISNLVPSRVAKQSKSLAGHIIHQRGKSRPEITGTQRMTIYFSDQIPKTLVTNHHCDRKTIYRIQNSPFSAFGLTYRQFKVFICDLLDDSCQMLYTNVSRVPILLPDLKENFRPGRKSPLGPFHKSLLRAILVHKSDLYLDQIVSFLLFVNSVSILHFFSFSHIAQNGVFL